MTFQTCTLPWLALLIFAVGARGLREAIAQVALGAGAKRHPNLCFVHLGKSGGASIVGGLKKLVEQGADLDFVQVHGKLGVNNYLPGPLTEGSPSEKACAATGRVLLWVRDPVSRLISTWNARRQLTGFSKRNLRFLAEHGLDSNMDLEHIMTALIQNNETLVHDYFDTITHANVDLSFYLGENCSALDRLPMYFAGTLEHMTDDWERFSAQVRRNGSGPVDLPHSHTTKPIGRSMPARLVEFVRRYYRRDYRCLDRLAQKGYLPWEYVASRHASSTQYEFLESAYD